MEGIVIKINFTKKQFRVLLDLVSAGNWVINSTKTPSEVKAEYEDLQQYILSYCEKYGFTELVDYNKEDNRYYESREYEESAIQQMIDEYDNDVFWDKLTFELAKRDVAIELIDADKKPSHDEWMERVLELEGFYEEEFSRNGLKNIKLGKGQ